MASQKWWGFWEMSRGMKATVRTRLFQGEVSILLPPSPGSRAAMAMSKIWKMPRLCWHFHPTPPRNKRKPLLYRFINFFKKKYSPIVWCYVLYKECQKVTQMRGK